MIKLPIHHKEYKRLSIKIRLRLFFKSYSGITFIIGFVSLIWTFLYRLVFLKYEAIYQWVYEISEIFYAIALSIIASNIFYLVLNYIPTLKKKKTVDKLIIKWLVQLEELGNTMFYDISGKSSNEIDNMSVKEWETCCDKILKSSVPNFISVREQIRIENWFVYFDLMFEYESAYLEILQNYSDALPFDIRSIFDNIIVKHNLRSALSTYREHYDEDEVYKKMMNLSHLIWHHICELRQLVKLYQEKSIF